MKKLTTQKLIYFDFFSKKLRTGDFWKYVYPKVPYFFFPEKVHVLHIFGENRLIEWKGCVFFFERQKKKIQILDRLNLTWPPDPTWPHTNFLLKKNEKKLKIILWNNTCLLFKKIFYITVVNSVPKSQYNPYEEQ